MTSFRVRRARRARHIALAAILLSTTLAFPQDSTPGWQQQVREQIKNQQLNTALANTEQRLAAHPEDLEARAWHARILAWKGCWADAENEYRRVLQEAPNDIDAIAGLSDVLLWQGRPEAALPILDRALSLSPRQPEILLRRARILGGSGRAAEAKNDFRQVLAFDPENREAKRGLAGLAEQSHHELRLGVDVDTFNYTDTAQAQTLTLASRWSPRWSTLLGTSFYQRFGENPGKFIASTAFRFTRKDWLNVGGAVANQNAVIPTSEAFFEYGHGFKFANNFVRGLEASYQQRWLCYRGAHVLTLSFTQIYYLPQEWTWALTVTGARSGFASTGVDWVPSGSSKLGFPLYPRLSGNLSFAVGSENFAQVDQIGRFSAYTFGAGLRYRFTRRQDLSGYVASQQRTQDRTQSSFGLSYGFRF
jgi:tetratricopeptide (TPR) repeat protein